MYTAWLSDNSIYPYAKCFYDNSTDAKELQLISPTLELEANKAGSFTFTVPPDHLYSGQFNAFTSIVYIVRDGVILWEGRVIDESSDFWNQKEYICEGALAYLNDSIQSHTTINDITPTELLSKILDSHNNFFIENGEPYKCIKQGVFNMKFDDAEDNGIISSITINYENTLEIVSTLLNRYGGYIYISWNSDGEKVLNWIHEDFLTNATQNIEFGSNLLDYVSNWEITDLCTAIIPLGKEIEDEEGNATGEKLTIKDVNNGSEILRNDMMVKKYGLIVKVLEYDDIEDPNELKTLGEKYLSKEQFDKMSIEISAYDLAMINPKVEWEPPLKGG